MIPASTLPSSSVSAHRSTSMPPSSPRPFSTALSSPAILSRALIDIRCFQPEIIRIDRDVCLLSCLVRVGNRRLHALLDTERRALVRITQDRQRLVDVLAANHVNYQPRFLRRPAKI